MKENSPIIEGKSRNERFENFYTPNSSFGVTQIVLEI